MAAVVSGTGIDVCRASANEEVWGYECNVRRREPLVNGMSSHKWLAMSILFVIWTRATCDLRSRQRCVNQKSNTRTGTRLISGLT